MSKTKFTTATAARKLMDSMAIAIDNMIDEIKKPVDPEINGSARKAELQSIKQTAIDCKELIVERQRLEQMLKDLKDNGGISKRIKITVAVLPNDSASKTMAYKNKEDQKAASDRHYQANKEKIKKKKHRKKQTCTYLEKRVCKKSKKVISLCRLRRKRLCSFRL